MNFQTVFFEVGTGKIITVKPNQYISSKWAKLRHCPGYKSEEVRVLYFPSTLIINVEAHHVHITGPRNSPQVADAAGMPLIYLSKRLAFDKARAQFQNIIVDMADSMGDNLYRAAAVIEAQKVFPELQFFCKVEHQYRAVMELIPEITLFTDYKTNGLDPKTCGIVTMPAAGLADPSGQFFPAPSGYGLYLGLTHVPYNIKLQLHADFSERFTDFAIRNVMRADGHNVVLQLRTKGIEGRSWSPTQINELAGLIKANEDCSIFYLGSNIDLPGESTLFKNLTGKSTWLETIFLLLNASHIICIDSAVLHLCHALGLKCFRLWGYSSPHGVLGEDPGPADIGIDIPASNDRIKQISPSQVFAQAFPGDRPGSTIVFDPAKDVSQHGTQELIFKWLADHPPKHRQLVDVGAWGKQMSNSYALLELGWKGLLIDANPKRIPELQRDFAGLDVEIISAGIGDKRGRFPLIIHTGDTSNTIVKGWDSATATKETVDIEVFPLQDILSDAKVPFDFDLLSVDAEGMDEKILKSLFAKSKYRPGLVVTEIKSHRGPVEFFKRFGYTLFARTGEHDKNNFIFGKTF
jgi:FkbM family methyltransferase